MCAKKKNVFSDDEESSYFESEKYEECRVCRQEYTGSCPISSARCPYADEGSDDDEEEDEEVADFEDVKNLKEILEDDEEAERLVDEEGEIPPEDLKEDD